MTKYLFTLCMILISFSAAANDADEVSSTYMIASNGSNSYVVDVTGEGFDRIWVQRGKSVYKAFYRDGRLIIQREPMENSQWMLETFRNKIIRIDSEDPIVLTLRQNGSQRVLRLNPDSRVFLAVTTNPSSSSSSSGADEDEQDIDPVDDGGHAGSDPLCRLTGTCTGSSSGSCECRSYSPQMCRMKTPQL